MFQGSKPFLPAQFTSSTAITGTSTSTSIATIVRRRGARLSVVMASDFTKLVEALFEDKSSPFDLCQRLRSDDSIKSGLQAFYYVLNNAVVSTDPKLSLLSWDNSQIQSVVSIAQAIVSNARSLSRTPLALCFCFSLESKNWSLKSQIIIKKKKNYYLNGASLDLKYLTCSSSCDFCQQWNMWS